MSQIKTIISSLSFAATLTAVLTSPALARADECNDIEQRKQRVAKELAKLTTDHPAVMLSVAACVEAARSRPEDEQAATMGLCVVGVCLFAGEATCDDVASRGLRFILEEVALEAMAPASCSERSMAPAPTTPPPAVDAPGILIANQCNHPVQVAIHYADTNRRWSTEGWWTVAANSRTGYLATKDGVLRSNTAQLYFFAESVDQSAWTWAGDHPTTVGDRTVAMRKLVDKEGDTEIVLVCEPSPSI